jgi:hypothetical protein
MGVGEDGEKRAAAPHSVRKIRSKSPHELQIAARLALVVPAGSAISNTDSTWHVNPLDQAAMGGGGGGRGGESKSASPGGDKTDRKKKEKKILPIPSGNLPENTVVIKVSG